MMYRVTLTVDYVDALTSEDAARRVVHALRNPAQSLQVAVTAPRAGTEFFVVDADGKATKMA